MNANFENTLQDKVKQTQEIVYRFLPKEEGNAKLIHEAMNYSLKAGGKRLRPLLMLEAYRMFGGQDEELVYPFMAALEMIHTYSLVHDDLPAMDNDEYRRGRLTTWKVYGEAMGVLAGDGLLNLSMETALLSFERLQEASSEALHAEKTVYMERLFGALSILYKKAGIRGMIGGQCVDVLTEQEEKSIDGDTLLYIHENKTAALLQAPLMIGALLAGADQASLKKMEDCGYYLGIAFQVQDDVLDVIGTQEELGKPIGSDAANGKQTYVTVYGLETAKETVSSYSRRAIAILQENAGDSDFLEDLFYSLIHRTK